MIDATQAKALYEESNANLASYLTTAIEPAVTEAAKAGKRTVDVHVKAHETWKNIAPSKYEQQVIVELEKLGYKASFGPYGSAYVPRANQDDHGHGPMHCNYGFTINW